MAGTARAIPASFRDPRGFVFERDGILYRQVAHSHAADYDQLMASGLYDELVSNGSLIPHREVDSDLALTPDVHKVLEPERVRFVSYPYEWSFTQLRDAALLTLSAQGAALERGMTLRDGSAFNVTFNGGKAVFLDTTSFGIYEDGQPWVAYRQFCEHFLAPLALMAYRDVRLGQLSRIHLDGIPLDLTTELLPTRAKAKPGLMMHVRLHAGSQQRHESDEKAPERKPFSRRSFDGLIDSLRRTIASLSQPEGRSAWEAYYSEADHYSDAASHEKEDVVGRWIDLLAPRTVWDLGANTGRFSRLASGRGIDVVALDSDPFCIDEAYVTARDGGDTHLTPIVSDLTNPSPGLGWANVERSSLEARGPADVVLGLALIHHLSIANNVPLGLVMDQFARLGRRAVVEFIPKEDPKVQRLLRDREDVFDDYGQDGFERAAATRFAIVERHVLADSGRTLYLLEGR